MAKWLIEVRDGYGTKFFGYHRDWQASGPADTPLIEVSLVHSETAENARNYPTKEIAEYQAAVLSQKFTDYSFGVVEI